MVHNRLHKLATGMTDNDKEAYYPGCSVQIRGSLDIDLS